MQALIKHLTNRLQDSYVPLSSFFTLLSQPDTLSDDDISEIANFFHIDTKCFNSEFKLFKEYLRIRGIAPKEVLNKLAASPAVSDLAAAYPSFHKASLQFLAAPVSTATVERTFSKMNHICNKVRQRLTPDHLEYAMLIALESTLESNSDFENAIRLWHSLKPRRLTIPPTTTNLT